MILKQKTKKLTDRLNLTIFIFKQMFYSAILQERRLLKKKQYIDFYRSRYHLHVFKTFQSF